MRTGCCLWVVIVFGAATTSTAQDFQVRLRSQEVSDEGAWHEVQESRAWDPRKVAFVVCDMWDRHWCETSAARVAEMAPHLDRVLRVARDRGALIVHAPSDTMDFYEGTAQRRRAQEAPRSAPPVPLQGWCARDPSKEPPLPIDDSDGGCDCGGTGYRAWSRQIASIGVEDADAVSDQGQEVYNLLVEAGIEHVVVSGVHTNMCVLGRPFAIRQLVGLGFDVALMRDLTDTMYNPAREPRVSHFRGTDLVVEHIERHWCPSLGSTSFTGEPEFRFHGDTRPRVCFVIAEDEYEAATTVPRFARRELEHRFGLQCEFVFGDPKPADGFGGAIDGLEAIERSDLVVLFVRRRVLPDEQLELLRRSIRSGRPVVGIRTSSHAFQNWLEFDPQVLGGSYNGHHGRKATVVQTLEPVRGHPVLRGVRADEFEVHSTLYKVSPLAETATPLMMGRLREGSRPEPVAWVHHSHGARVFYTSLGAPRDFEAPSFVRLLRNGIFWALRLPPSELPVDASAESAAGSSERRQGVPPAQ